MNRSKLSGKRYKIMIFIRDAVKKIAIGAILLKPITLQLHYMKWRKKSLNHDYMGFIGLLGKEGIC